MIKLTGLEYLKADIAANFGLDKANWDKRIKWFDDNENQLASLVQKAKKPAQYYAGLLAYQDFLEGNPSGYTISCDATASGTQLMAIISGDKTAAKLSNLIDEGNCVDTYLELYSALKEFGIPEGSTRDDVKKAIMTYLYGSTARPEMLFGSHVDVFYMGINMLMPGVCGLNQVLLNMWNKTTLSHDWVLPDNFHVHTKVYNEVAIDVPLFGSKVRITREVNMPNKYGKATSANAIHSVDGLVVREVIGRCNYDLNHVSKIHSWIFNSWYGGQSTEHNVHMVQTLWNHYLKTGFLSVRILNYIDKGTLELIDRTVLFNLLETLPKKPFQVISIHDAFRCLPNYGNDLRQQYNQILYELYNSSIGSSIVSQLAGKEVKLPKLDNTWGKLILDANYSLC